MQNEPSVQSGCVTVLFGKKQITIPKIEKRHLLLDDIHPTANV